MKSQLDLVGRRNPCFTSPVYLLRRRPPPNVNPLRPLPRLHAGYKDAERDGDDPPLPAHSRVQEDVAVQNRDIQCGEGDEKDADDGPEQEPVLPKVSSPYAEALWHIEKGAAQIDDDPSVEKKDPCNSSIAGCSGAKYRVT